MTVFWPRNRFIPRDPLIEVLPRTTMGPPALSGFRQAVGSSAAAWRVVYAGMPVMTTSDILFWRSLAAQIEGRATRIVLPVHDRAPLALVPASVDTETTVDHSDGAEHSDGTGYAQPPSPVVLSAAAALGATSLTVAKTSAVTLLPGQHFSLRDRLYRVAGITSQSSSLAVFKVWPRLRQALPIGETLDFATPTVTVRLTKDDGMHTALNYGRYALATVEFIEDPT